MCRHSHTQQLRSFWSAPRIVTSCHGKVQHWKSTIHRLPITLPMLRVKSDEFYAHAQKIRLDQRSWFLVLAKRSAASRDENAVGGKPNTLCSSQKYPCPPLGRLTEILRGRGVSKTQFSKQKYDNKTEFLEGWGGVVVQTKNLPWEWYG